MVTQATRKRAPKIRHLNCDAKLLVQMRESVKMKIKSKQIEDVYEEKTSVLLLPSVRCVGWVSPGLGSFRGGARGGTSLPFGPGVAGGSSCAVSDSRRGAGGD